MKFKWSQTQLTLVVSVFFAIFYNFSFFRKTLEVYPANSANIFFLISLFLILTCAINLFLNLLRIKPLYKVFLIVLFFLSALAAYVMDSFGIAIDDNLLLGVLKTNSSESLELITPKMLLYYLILFILPSIFIYKVKIESQGFKREMMSRMKSIGISLVVILVMLVSFGKFYASFFRAHKPLRYYTNPTYYMYVIGRYSGNLFEDSSQSMQALGRDSVVAADDNDRELIILVIGETARRDRFSLNGHNKETNPLLKKEKVFSFTNVTSCGTATAVSVPCLFSNQGRKNFNVRDGRYTENLLDVLGHTKNINVLWRDNNSDSKGVAARAKYEDFKTPETNTICNPECRDEGMLVGLQEHINSVKEKDVMIVLHQMGNHGPAYYKRYPKEFEVFKPVCETNELSNCTNEEIGNAYDNAILYTDYFLSKVISLLKSNSEHFHTAMVYVSDHGESLGENGIYLHSMPYMIAPKEQIEIPLIMWFGGKMQEQVDFVSLKKILNNPFSHDNIFHTIMGLMEVKSSVYELEKDILNGIQNHQISIKRQ